MGFYPWNRNNANTLLIKDDVGRAKYSAYNLPPAKYTYGRPLERDAEGAKEVSMTWKYHQETRNKEPERDFAKLNKLSLGEGLYRSEQFSNYRRQIDARLKVPKGRNALPLYIPEEEFRYGQPNRPSTPMNLVMGNSYGLDYQQRLEQEYMWRTHENSFRPRLMPKGNKASDLSYTYNQTKLGTFKQQNPQDLFKITKFKKVLPRTNTYLKKSSAFGASSQATISQPNQLSLPEVPNQAVE